MNVMGVDADSKKFAVAVLASSGTLVDGVASRVCIRSEAETPQARRASLAILFEMILERTLLKLPIDLVVIEEPLAMRNMKATRAILGTVYYLEHVCQMKPVPVVCTTDASWKSHLSVTTKGGRDAVKENVVAALRARQINDPLGLYTETPVKDILPPPTQDEWDALGIALYGLEVLVNTVFTPCPICGTRFLTATDAFSCWLLHDHHLMETRSRQEIATALNVTPSRISQIMRVLGFTTRKPYTRRTTTDDR